jgi:hypothetical protein
VDRIANDDDAWKNKRIYLGGGLGYARATWTHDYYSFNESVSKSENMITPSFVIDFALADFFSIGVSLYLGIGLDGTSSLPVIPYIPLLAKIGGKFGIVELTGNIGYIIAQGFTLGGTIGFNIGSGILYAEVLGIPWGAPPSGFILDSAIVGGIGYKVGVGKNRK